MIITISGTPGSGKTTIVNILAKKFKAERISVGGIRRELARERGLTLEELNKYALKHPESDVNVDKKVAAEAKELAKTGKTVIVEGRTQFHFLPESVKIYMKVNPEEGARRIWQDLKDEKLRKKRNEGQITSLKDLQKELKRREANDIQRYQKYYGIDHTDEAHYDLVIDTTELRAEEVAKKIINYLKLK